MRIRSCECRLPPHSIAKHFRAPSSTTQASLRSWLSSSWSCTKSQLKTGVGFTASGMRISLSHRRRYGRLYGMLSPSMSDMRRTWDSPRDTLAAIGRYREARAGHILGRHQDARPLPCSWQSDPARGRNWVDRAPDNGILRCRTTAYSVSPCPPGGSFFS